jgi:hypothetical protein
MSLQSLVAGIKTFCPVVYGAWKENSAPPLPYVVLIEDGNDDFHADDTRLITIPDYRIELYFDVKTPSLEEKLEIFLTSNGWLWDCDGDEYIDTEKMFMRTYYAQKGE